MSLVPVEHVCRLVRESGRVATYRLGPRGLSAEDGRRIAFHIRFNRPSSLFARCWLLVEGETEVWLLNELARQCGYHFEAEGVRVIEFAQCGLKPLLRFARRMGIEWHALVDGDEAGKKYANTVRSLLDNHEDNEARSADRVAGAGHGALHVPRRVRPGLSPDGVGAAQRADAGAQGDPESGPPLVEAGSGDRGRDAGR